MKRAFLLIFSLALCLTLYACGDDTESAPTTNPNSNLTESTPTAECNHDYKIADTVNSTCSEFGKTVYKCSKCAHQYQMEQPKLPHTFEDATCTDPKTCAVCGATEGTALEHLWEDPTCTEAAYCLRCGYTDGQPAGHQYSNFSCTEQNQCEICGEIIAPSSHVNDNGTCSICHQPYSSFGLEYTYYGDCYYVSGIGTCTDTDVVIPETYNGLPVTGMQSFWESEHMVSLYIPASITTIGSYTSQLHKGAERVATITLPSTNRFRYCAFLENIIVDSNNPNYCSVDGILYDKNCTTLYVYPKARPGRLAFLPALPVSMTMHLKTAMA